jgi:hypothetical protein
MQIGYLLLSRYFNEIHICVFVKAVPCHYQRHEDINNVDPTPNTEMNIDSL